jgi:hypothetical protein
MNEGKIVNAFKMDENLIGSWKIRTNQNNSRFSGYGGCLELRKYNEQALKKPSSGNGTMCPSYKATE